MTQEQQDEIWAMLDAESKTAMSRLFHNTPSEKDETKLLEMLFGSHNLTAQTEEKPKESDIDGKFHTGDMVITAAYCNSYDKGLIGIVINCHDSDIDVWIEGRIIHHVPLCDLEPYTEPKADVKEIPLKIQAADSLFQMAKDEMGITDKVDYTQYRLDLTKEIAVALVDKLGKTGLNTLVSRFTIADDSVMMANEIVKRLKETEI